MQNKFYCLITGLTLANSLALTGCQTTVSPYSNPTLQQRSNHTLIVMFEPNFDKNALLQTITAYQGRVIYDYNTLHGMAITFPQGTAMPAVMQKIRTLKGINGVTMDSIQTIQ